MIDLNYKDINMSWRTATIPKKSGGKRKLCIPNDDLKMIQRQILEYLYTIPSIKISKCAHGFVPYRNTSTGIIRHDKNYSVILCMDIKDFFDNFPLKAVEDALVSSGMYPAEAKNILKLCSYNNGLPQGGPCSPYLTNIGMFKVDCIIKAFATKYGFKYSRYADDITLSSTKEYERLYSFKWVFKAINKILNDNLNLYLKKSKSHIIWRNSRISPRVTGIVIRGDSNGYNAPKKFRYNTRAAVYNLATSIMKKGNKPDTEDFIEWRKILGRVQYMDKLRSYSEEGFNTADPKIQLKYFKYLTEVFNHKNLI